MYGFYTVVVSLAIILSDLKAYIFCLVVFIFLKTDFTKPFHPTISSLITKIGRHFQSTGVLALAANVYSNWLAKKELPFCRAGGVPNFCSWGVIVFLIAVTFRRGVEMRSKNDLTVYHVHCCKRGRDHGKTENVAEWIFGKVDLTLSNFSILKTGKAEAVPFSILEAICKALDCQPGDILEYLKKKER